MAKNFVPLLKKYYKLSKVNSGSFSSSVKILPKSALLISGERAVDTYVVVIPHLDFDNRFFDIEQLKENVKKRKLDFNITEMKDSWDFYKDWNEKKMKMLENLNRAGRQINELEKKKESEVKMDEFEKLSIYKNLLREELQQVKKTIWDMEDNVICELLKLPNLLHPESPDIEEELFVFDKENIKESFDHLQVGVKLDCLEYRDKLTYFLKNKAALFELAVPEFFIEKFSNQGFIQFSNPDLTRSVLSEGVGIALNETSQLFLLENTEGNNDRLHLCGGGSLFPFCGFHAKHSIQKQLLPVKYVTCGRCYSPVTNDLPGLYSTNQSTSVEFFVATFSEEDLYNNYQSCIQNLKNLFIDLGLKFRIVKQPPYLFKNWESLRVSIQVFSPFRKVYIEVGHVSLVGDFISKRLRMCYVDKTEERFMKVLSGTVVNTQVLLALCLERSDSDLFIPDDLKEYMLRL